MALLPIPADLELELTAGLGLSIDLTSNRKRYGDGYSQNASKGIMPEPQQWRLVWKDLEHSEIETLREFFVDLHQKGESFSWTPHGQTVERSFEPNGIFSVSYSVFAVGDVSLDIKETTDALS